MLSQAHTPFGLLWLDGELYVSSDLRVDAFGGFDGKAFATHREVIEFPAGVGEVNGMAVAPDGRVALGISAPCDACETQLDESAAVVSFLPDGSDLRVMATGIRAAIGLAYFPGTDDLFVTMNHRDDLGADTPGDWLGVVEEGQDWGFPDCYGQGTGRCAELPGPVAEFAPHAAVSGIAFVAGELGDAVGTGAAVAAWAEGRVEFVALQAGAAGYAATAKPFLDGFENPVPVVLGPDGALYVGDWGAGTVIRIWSHAG